MVVHPFSQYWPNTVPGQAQVKYSPCDTPRESMQVNSPLSSCYHVGLLWIPLQDPPSLFLNTHAGYCVSGLHFMLLRHPCLNQPQQDWVTRSLCFTEKGYTRLACGREIWSMARKLCVLGVKALWETTDMDTAIIPLRKHRRHVWIRTCCALNSSTSIWLLIYCTKKVANNTLIVKMYTYYMQRQDNAQMSIYKEDGHL